MARKREISTRLLVHISALFGEKACHDSRDSLPVLGLGRELPSTRSGDGVDPLG